MNQISSCNLISILKICNKISLNKNILNYSFSNSICKASIWNNRNNTGYSYVSISSCYGKITIIKSDYYTTIETVIIEKGIHKIINSFKFNNQDIERYIDNLELFVLENEKIYIHKNLDDQLFDISKFFNTIEKLI